MPLFLYGNVSIAQRMQDGTFSLTLDVLNRESGARQWGPVVDAPTIPEALHKLADAIASNTESKP